MEMRLKHIDVARASRSVLGFLRFKEERGQRVYNEIVLITRGFVLVFFCGQCRAAGEYSFRGLFDVSTGSVQCLRRDKGTCAVLTCAVALMAEYRCKWLALRVLLVGGTFIVFVWPLSLYGDLYVMISDLR